MWSNRQTGRVEQAMNNRQGKWKGGIEREGARLVGEALHGAHHNE